MPSTQTKPIYSEVLYNLNGFIIASDLTWLSQLGLQNTPATSLQRGLDSPNLYPGYDTKQSDYEALVILELWGM